MADGKSILLAGLLAAMCSASSWASEPTGAFQGLPWGASEREIESRFPGQLKRNACQDTLAKLQTAGGRVCDNPIIEPYEVFGIPFKLSFGLSKEKRALVDVVLFYAAPPVESTAELTLEQAWSIRYDRLYEALVARYGKAAFKSPRMGDEKYAGYSATWEMADTTIELTARLSVGGRGGDSEQFQVWYKPRGGSDARKL